MVQEFSLPENGFMIMERNPVVLTGIEVFCVNLGLYKIIYMIDGEIKIDVCVPVHKHPLGHGGYDEVESIVHT